MKSEDFVKSVKEQHSGENMEHPVIVSIVRTPIGSFGGSLSTMTAVDIGTVVVKEALKRASLKPELVDNVILGHVLQAGQGQNTARQVGLRSGIPIEVPAITINQVCGSGLRAISLAAQIIKAGDAEVIVAGGMEVMSNVPYALHEARTGYRLSDGKIIDLIESTEAFASQAIVVNREMGWDSAKVNMNGGAIALGNPIGATGARILTSLIYSMKRRNDKRGLATLCVGGGQGVAMTIEME